MNQELNKQIKQNLEENINIINNLAHTQYKLGYEAGKKDADIYWKKIIQEHIDKIDKILK